MSAPSDAAWLATTEATSRRAGLGTARLTVDGRHLLRHGVPHRIKGVTYGSFGRRTDGASFPEPAQVRADFAGISAAGLNAVRTYAVPPADVLDAADEFDLDLIVGLHYEDWRTQAVPGRRANLAVLDAGRREVESALARLAGDPRVAAVAVGNEIPVDLVRINGIAEVENVLATLAADLHAGDPDMLVTYANFPTTEFLAVEGLDFVSFNVFLEHEADLVRYLRHLQRLSGDRPVVISELGLAAGLHGEEAQARALETQLRVVDEAGCAGATVFAWTDEWIVAEQPVVGWGFGLTDARRRPKQALEVVSSWARRRTVDLRADWPSMTVIVCAYNEGPRIDRCLASLCMLDYPDLEVILCDDGSTDDTLPRASGYPVRALALPHAGLSAARNAGIAAASGRIVAFLDADAFAHPEWPFHLAMSLQEAGVAATGGPNLPVPDVGFVERAVALAPGAPVEVLVSDDRAEHVPGCNMAYWRQDLEDIGGFDVAYTAAGDDVDVCWKLLDRGRAIAFAPAAQVRHHRRGTVRGYLRQQRGYGRAERMLSGRHRHRFNRLGQARWAGSIYTGPRLLPNFLRPVVYHGVQASAPFQKQLRHPGHTLLGTVGSLLPALAPLSVLGLLLSVAATWALLLPAACLGAALGYGVLVALGTATSPDELAPRRLRGLVAVLHVLQPFVRTWGRLRGSPLEALPDRVTNAHGLDRPALLSRVQRHFASRRCHLAVGGEQASWDLRVSVGPMVGAYVTAAVRWDWFPLLRCRLRPRPGLFVTLVLAAVLTPIGLVPAALVAATVLIVAAAETWRLAWLSRAVARAIVTAPDLTVVVPSQPTP